MAECTQCTYYGLFKMIKSGRPLQYYGDIPCQRCCNLKKEHSEFTPASKEIDRQAWSNLEYVAK